ncbi:MAG: hypothetical protein JWM85_2869 [Acidimicrobiaceae bacterium]|nr:hypothetical protein [Acidimicrobiaceae bacterium]
MTQEVEASAATTESVAAVVAPTPLAGSDPLAVPQVEERAEPPVGSGPVPPRESRWRWTGAPRWLGHVAPLIAGLLGAGLAAYNLTRPEGLHGVVQYDDGVYYGSALRLVAGVLPYRSYVFVQPPGISLLMAPVALLTHGAGAAEGLAVARVITAVVVGLNALLVAQLLRHRGLAASLGGGIALAVFPGAFFADRTLLLEPYLVLLCLVAARLAFRSGQLARPGRLIAAGAFMGFAGTVKTWAILPAVALALCAAFPNPDRSNGGVRRGLFPVLAGTVGGFAVTCEPFIAVAPAAFWREVVTSQLVRSHGTASLASRLPVLAGAVGIEHVNVSLRQGEAIALVLAAVLVAGSALPAFAGRGDRLEVFALLGAAVSLAAVTVSSEFYNHYAYFPAAFCALVLGYALGRGAELAALGATAVIWGRAARGSARAGGVRLAGALVLGAATVFGLVRLLPSESHFDANKSASTRDPGLAIDLAVPRSACTISDAAVLLVAANRMSGSHGGCPQFIDATGEWLVVSPKHPALGCGPVDPSLVAIWSKWLSQASFFVQSGTAANRIPWTTGLRAQLHREFERVPDPGAMVYVRRSYPGAAALMSPARWTLPALAARGWVPNPGPPRPAKPPSRCPVRAAVSR